MCVVCRVLGLTLCFDCWLIVDYLSNWFLVRSEITNHLNWIHSSRLLRRRLTSTVTWGYYMRKPISIRGILMIILIPVGAWWLVVLSSHKWWGTVWVESSAHCVPIIALALGQTRPTTERNLGWINWNLCNILLIGDIAEVAVPLGAYKFGARYTWLELLASTGSRISYETLSIRVLQVFHLAYRPPYLALKNLHIRRPWLSHQQNILLSMFLMAISHAFRVAILNKTWLASSNQKLKTIWWVD